MLSTLTNRFNRMLLMGCVLTLVTLCAAGCKSMSNPLVRTNADFSGLAVDQMQEVAAYIETQVREGNRTPELTNRENFIVNTEEIQQTLRSRAARAELIQVLLDSGHAVEQFDGKISVLRTAAYRKSGDRHDKDRDAMIVISENRDRVILYDSLRDANNYSSAARSAIEEIFYAARKAALKPGQKYLDNGGEAQAN